MSLTDDFTKASPTSTDLGEVGSTGLVQYGGEGREDFLRQLQGKRGYATYREMADNHPVRLSYQFHIVHQGGQLFASGPVGDSWGGGPGVIVDLPKGLFDGQTAEIHGLVSRDIPDRTLTATAGTGFGIFTRYSAQRAGWRGHVIAWRARDFVKQDGDQNYGSLREDGRLVGLRHYFEAGLTRTYYPAPQMGFEVAARIHRVDTHHDYSFRILAKVDLNIALPTPGVQ